ncbi:hypothetical protein NMY22_g9777 [Coprinellus aureogranulatus]|nr:hypothetical protein NMY22_g9777 [Coprinellus aureogranulatus]
MGWEIELKTEGHWPGQPIDEASPTPSACHANKRNIGNLTRGDPGPRPCLPKVMNMTPPTSSNQEVDTLRIQAEQKDDEVAGLKAQVAVSVWLDISYHSRNMDPQGRDAEIAELKRQKEELRQLNEFYKAEVERYKKEALEAKSKLENSEVCDGKADTEEGRGEPQQNLKSALKSGQSQESTSATKNVLHREKLEERRPLIRAHKHSTPGPIATSYNLDGLASPRVHFDNDKATHATQPSALAPPILPQISPPNPTPFYKTKKGRLIIAAMLVIILTIAIAVGVVVGRMKEDKDRDQVKPPGTEQPAGPEGGMGQSAGGPIHQRQLRRLPRR